MKAIVNEKLHHPSEVISPNQWNEKAKKKKHQSIERKMSHIEKLPKSKRWKSKAQSENVRENRPLTTRRHILGGNGEEENVFIEKSSMFYRYFK